MINLAPWEMYLLTLSTSPYSDFYSLSLIQHPEHPVPSALLFLQIGRLCCSSGGQSLSSPRRPSRFPVVSFCGLTPAVVWYHHGEGTFTFFTIQKTSALPLSLPWWGVE
jgi:hypothetical protein